MRSGMALWGECADQHGGLNTGKNLFLQWYAFLGFRRSVLTKERNML